MLSSSRGLCRSVRSTLRLSAYEAADLTRPSISAPLKLRVAAARPCRSTSVPRNELVDICVVCVMCVNVGVV